MPGVTSQRLSATSIGLVLAVLCATAQSQPPANPRLDKLKEWMTVVARHQPGQVDASVHSVRLWTRESLQNVRDDLYALRRLICSKPGREPEAPPASCTPPATNQRGVMLAETTVGRRNRSITQEWAGVYTVNHLRDLSELALEIDRGDINDILKRGALLHTDVALRTPPIVTFNESRVERFLMKATVRVVDGRQSGVDQSVDHLEMARRLFDIVTPDPRRDPITYPERDGTVRDWYRATMAVLLNDQGVFQSHARAALEIFRDDDEMLFQAGAMHVALATPQYQQGVTIRRRANVSFIESGDEERHRAEQFFRQALKANPNHDEARLALGQVLGQSGRSADALAELRQVQAATRDPLLSYYAALFIGREESARNNVDAAREAYQQAATLFPRAQSPYIGLSELHMRAGNRMAAAQALDSVWQLGPSQEDADDPWWHYPYTAGRKGEALLEAIGKAFPPVTVP